MTRTLAPANRAPSREIGHIGGGNAATSLSMLPDCRVEIEVRSAASLLLDPVRAFELPA